MKKIFLVTILLSLSFVAGAQQVARNNHMFFHVDLAAGNVYTAAYPSLVTWGLNTLTNSNIFENAYEHNIWDGEFEKHSLHTRNYHYDGFKAHDLFTNIHPNVKLGYQSRIIGDFNWGAYASGEYQYNQFRTSFEEEQNINNKLQRVALGGSFFVVLGGSDKPYHFMIEAGCRYNVAIDYKGALGDDKKDINNGISSHIAFKVTGPGAIQDLGIYADIPHYNLMKCDGMKLKMYSVGLMWTVTPGQSKKRHDIY